MIEIDPPLARALADTLLDLLPDYQLAREVVARKAQVAPQFVEGLYDSGTAVDQSEIIKLAKFLGIHVETYLASARLALE